MIQISIVDEADQQFGLIVNGVRVTIRLRYSTVSEGWSFDLSIDDEPILHGRRIVDGCDLLAPFNLGIGALVAYPVVAGSIPDRASLPSGAVGLFHIPPEELT